MRREDRKVFFQVERNIEASPTGYCFGAEYSFPTLYIAS